MEVNLGYRTYNIQMDPSQDVIDVNVSDNHHKLALAWLLMPNKERQTTFIKIDGDEQEILSAKLTPDRKTLVVIVSYQIVGNGNCDQRILPLNHFLSDDLKMRSKQYDIQNRIEKVRQAKPDPTKIHFCFTQTYHDLNYGS